jgi:DNA invertase Pin-like site-specific DNA recombinase
MSAKDGIAVARAKGRMPGRQPLDMGKIEAAIKLIEANISPTEAAKQLGIGRSTIYREIRRLGIRRPD